MGHGARHGLVQETGLPTGAIILFRQDERREAVASGSFYFKQRRGGLSAAFLRWGRRVTSGGQATHPIC